MINKPFVYCISAIFCFLGLIGCTPVPKVIVPFQQGSSPIRSLDIILANPQFNPYGDGLSALNSEGWATGGFEFNFCDGLVEKLKSSNVEAQCVLSFWGKKVPFKNAQSQPASHVMTIKPLDLQYLVQSRNGVVISIGLPSMDTLTEITDNKTKRIVWSGNVKIIFSAYDSKGTKFYSRSLIGSLQDSGATPK